MPQSDRKSFVNLCAVFGRHDYERAAAWLVVIVAAVTTKPNNRTPRAAQTPWTLSFLLFAHSSGIIIHTQRGGRRTTVAPLRTSCSLFTLFNKRQQQQQGKHLIYDPESGSFGGNIAQFPPGEPDVSAFSSANECRALILLPNFSARPQNKRARPTAANGQTTRTRSQLEPAALARDSSSCSPKKRKCFSLFAQDWELSFLHNTQIDRFL